MWKGTADQGMQGTAEPPGDVRDDPSGWTVGRRIRHARDLLKIPQRELAARTHVSVTMVQGWERGDSQPRPSRMPEVADALGVTENWLRFGMDEIPTATTMADMSERLARVEALLIGVLEHLERGRDAE